MSGRVEVIESVERLAAIVPAWRDLWSRVETATPFQSPDWLLPWWDIFAPGDLCVFAIWAAGTLIGIVPLYVETVAERRRLLPLGVSLSDYLDVIFDDGRFDDAAEAFVAALDGMRDVSACEFPDVSERGQVLQIRSRGHWQCQDSAANVCPAIALPNNVAELAGHIPPSRLRHLGTARRRASRRGETAIIVGDVDNSEALLAELIRLELLRWNGGVFSDSRVGDFHAAALPGLMGHELARIYALEIAEETAAVWYGFVHRQRTYAYLCAFDPQYRFESPGAILIGHAIEESVQAGAREFDFLRGRETYKYEWGARDRINSRRIFRRVPQ